MNIDELIAGEDPIEESSLALVDLEGIYQKLTCERDSLPRGSTTRRTRVAVLAVAAVVAVAIALSVAFIPGVQSAAASLLGIAQAASVDRPCSASTVTVLARLTAPGAESDAFGAFSNAVSGDAVLVGAPFYHGGAGRAYVFTRGAHGWAVNDLTGSDTVAGDDFGAYVAISGATAVVLAPSHNNGVAYVFGKTASAWRQEAELEGTASEAQYHFASVAISGSTIVVGSWNEAGQAIHADVFVKTSTGWQRQSELQGPALGAGPGPRGGPVPGTEFAALVTSVAVSGGTIVVGTNGKGSGASVFSRTPSGWHQSAELSVTDGADDGYSVAVSGQTIVLDAFPDGLLEGPIVSYVYARSTSLNMPNVWSEVASNHLSDSQGDFVASSGTTIAEIGLGRNNPTGVAIYTKSAAHLTLACTNPVGFGWAHTNSDLFGVMPAVSGSTVVLGAPGSVYVLHVQMRKGAR